MKNYRKIVFVSAVILCLGVILMLAGCEKTKMIATADECEKFYFNFFTKNDKTGMEQFHLTEDQANDIIKIQNDALRSNIKEHFKATGAKLSDEQLDEICKATNDAFSKLNTTFESGKENGNTVTVTVTTQYIDTNELDKKALQDAQKYVITLELTDYKEIHDKLMELYVQNYINEIKNFKPSDDTNKGTFELKLDKKAGMWVPNEDSKEEATKCMDLIRKKNKG